MRAVLNPAAADLPMNHVSTRAAEQGDDFMRAAEAAQTVHDRHQYFVWTQLHLHRFLPHDLAVMQLSRAGGREALFATALRSVPLPAGLLAQLETPQGEFWRALVNDWVFQGRQIQALPLAQVRPVSGGALQELQQAGFHSVLVMGVDSRSGVAPEAMFAFFLREPQLRAARIPVAGLLLPYLYLMATRSMASGEEARPDAPTGRGSPPQAMLTQREIQILDAVRQARHNAEIGLMLGITAPTVKNHLRKIMRKLGAANRAQAVAEAMKRRLIV